MEVNMSGEWRVHGKRKQKRQEGQGNGVAENYSNSNSDKRTGFNCVV